MHIEKGEIYLANLGDKKSNDIGKIRPVLIFQNNFLNRMIDDSCYKDVVVIPLSSKIVDNDFSFFIKKRDLLEKDSIILCNAIKMIDANRLDIENGVLTKLSVDETRSIEKILYYLFDCKV